MDSSNPVMMMRKESHLVCVMVAGMAGWIEGRMGRMGKVGCDSTTRVALENSNINKIIKNFFKVHSFSHRMSEVPKLVRLIDFTLTASTTETFKSFKKNNYSLFCQFLCCK